MAAIYNKAYVGSGASADTEPLYLAVPNSRPKNSSNKCRLFLFIVSTFLIGCVVGGVIIHLWTRRNEDCSGSVKNLDDVILSSTYPTMPSASPSSCPTCPTMPCTSPSSCPTCPTMPSTSPSSCPTCPTMPSTSPSSCPTCPTIPRTSPSSCPSCPTLPSAIPPSCPTCPTLPSTSPSSCPTCPTLPSVIPSSCPTCLTLPSTSPSSCPTCPSLPPTNPSSCTCPTVTSTSTSPTPVATDIAFPEDCQEVKDRGNVTSGQYMISPQDEEGPFPVYCDMDTDGGGWTVFQRREDGSVNFYLDWVDYEDGFGNVTSEHWLGNKKIHRLTAQGHYELRVDMADFEGNTAYAKYDFFRMDNACTQYRLRLGNYSGDAGDSLSVNAHVNRPFSTKDREVCARRYKGAWWYGVSPACHASNLNGLYHGGSHESFADGINWREWKGYDYSLKDVEMKIRMVNKTCIT